MVCIGFGKFILHGVWTLECYVCLCDSAYGVMSPSVICV